MAKGEVGAWKLRTVVLDADPAEQGDELLAEAEDQQIASLDDDQCRQQSALLRQCLIVFYEPSDAPRPTGWRRGLPPSSAGG